MEHVAGVEEINAYISVGNHEGKRELLVATHRWEDNIKGIGYECGLDSCGSG
jgi:hypothetical protein